MCHKHIIEDLESVGVFGMFLQFFPGRLSVRVGLTSISCELHFSLEALRVCVEGLLHYPDTINLLALKEMITESYEAHLNNIAKTRPSNG